MKKNLSAYVRTRSTAQAHKIAVMLRACDFTASHRDDVVVVENAGRYRRDVFGLIERLVNDRVDDFGRVIA